MKIITIVLFVVLSLIASENKKVQFELSIGKYTLKANEYVYKQNNYKKSNDKLSHLIWNIDDANIINAKFVLALNTKSKLYVGANLGLGLDGSGYMDDFDWLCGSSNYSCQETSWSHFSHSPNTKVSDITKKKLFLKKELFDKTIVSNIYVGFRHDEFEFVSYNRGTNYIYTSEYTTNFRDIISTDNSSLAKSKGITYRQTYSGLYVGLEAEKTIQNTNLSLKIEYSPLISLNAYDNHHNTNIQYKETYYSFSSMIDIDLQISTNIKKDLDIFLWYNYLKYYLNDTGQTDYYDHGNYVGSSIVANAGASLDTSSLNIGLVSKF